MSARAIAAIAAIVAAMMFIIWLLVASPPRCDDGKIAVMGEGKWYCVEATEVPTRG